MKNLVPLPYRRVSVQPYSGEMTEEGIRAHLLGREAYRRTDYVVLEAEGAAVPLSPNMPGVAHVCLEVADIHEAERHLLSHGATPQGRMTEIAEDSMRPGKAGYIRDPNGIVIELLELSRPTD